MNGQEDYFSCKIWDVGSQKFAIGNKQWAITFGKIREIRDKVKTYT